MYLEKNYLMNVRVTPLTSPHRKRKQAEGGYQELLASVDVTEGGQTSPTEAVAFLTDKVDSNFYQEYVKISSCISPLLTHWIFWPFCVTAELIISTIFYFFIF